MGSRNHIRSILQALLVTFLWSTSFIIIKKGLLSIPPVTFAGLRYFLASICLLLFSWMPRYRSEIRGLSRKNWIKLISLGVVFYVFTQGAQFVGLSLLPSTTVSLMLNFTPAVVVLLGIVFIHEKPSSGQILGIFLFIGGALVYFLPVSGLNSQYVGLIVMVAGIVSNAISSVLGRNINRRKNISPYTVTLISMMIGSCILLGAGLVSEGIPFIPIRTWFSLLWLSVVNTAFAFMLWNHTLRNLTAMESSIINGTMLIQIAILAWLFLGEKLSIMRIGGMFIASLGAIMVQLRSGIKNTRS